MMRLWKLMAQPALGAGVLAAVLVGVLTAAPAEAGAQKKGCFKCHGDPGLNKKHPGRNLLVDQKVFKKTVHGDMDCTDCHSQIKVKPEQMHEVKLGSPDCSSCHEDAAKAYKQSVHYTKRIKGNGLAATCWSCHGTHDIYKVKDVRSRVSKRKLPQTCASCHQNPKYKTRRAQAVRHYKDSLHGRALRDGHMNAPSCGDCHGSHDIREKSDPKSKVHHSQEPMTCGKCHGRVARVYAKSVHGRLLWPDGIFPLDRPKPAKGDDAAKNKGGKAPALALPKNHPNGPVCSDCHTAHEVQAPSRRAFKLQSDDRCGRCHKDRMKHYRDTYHGKANALGMTGVAACYDCHGHHEVLPHTNPKSMLSAERKLATCQRCHPKATKNFTGYMAHADHWDQKNYPRLYWVTLAMTVLLLSVFAFFLLHTLLWTWRNLRNYMADPKGFRAAKAKTRELKKLYVRFRPVDRFLHIILFSSVITLVITGMPLKFHWTAWAAWVFDMLGGPVAAASVHRIAAVVLMTAFAIHVLSLVTLIYDRRDEFKDEDGRFSVWLFLGFIFGPDSLVPNFQDAKDLVAQLKYFMGLAPQPTFDRWTYWEKFDYMAVFWGMAIIGLSGLFMWIPETVTRWLPGWTINMAQVIHSDEALLAAGFLFTFHFFHSHLRSDKFPMDHVIFSGRVSEAELKHERGRLYDRLKAADQLQPAPGGATEWNDWKSVLIPIGMFAFAIGLLLAVAIYVSILGRFF